MCYSILIMHIYIDIPNCDNVTMYYYMYFTTLLHVFLHADDVTPPNRCLIETVAHVASVEGPNTNVSDHRRQLLGMNVFARSGYFSFSWSLEIH